MINPLGTAGPIPLWPCSEALEFGSEWRVGWETIFESDRWTSVATNMAAPAPPQSSKGLRCREIEERDIEDIVALLAKGFTVRSRRYWARALDRLSHHPTPAGSAEAWLSFGICAASRSASCLLIFSGIVATAADAGHPLQRLKLVCRAGVSQLRLACWCCALSKHKHVTYLNISPAPHTRATIEAQGFSALLQRPASRAADAQPPIGRSCRC